jgi:hypothetical protein
LSGIFEKGGTLQNKIDHINKTYKEVTASKAYSSNRVQVISEDFNTLNEIKNKEFNGKGLIERYGNMSSVYVLYSNEIYAEGGILDAVFESGGGATSSIGGTSFSDADLSGIFEKGGKIKNQYIGKSASEVWGMWTEKQRSHFLLDHSELLDNDRMENNLGYSRIVQKDMSYSDLTPMTKKVLEAHIQGGQYAHGGELHRNEMYAKGGMTQHGLHIGDMIIGHDDNSIVVKDRQGKTFMVNLNLGKRWSMNEWDKLSTREQTKIKKD